MLVHHSFDLHRDDAVRCWWPVSDATLTHGAPSNTDTLDVVTQSFKLATIENHLFLDHAKAVHPINIRDANRFGMRKSDPQSQFRLRLPWTEAGTPTCGALESDGKNGGPGRTRTCDMTVMSGPF